MKIESFNWMFLLLRGFVISDRDNVVKLIFFLVVNLVILIKVLVVGNGVVYSNIFKFFVIEFLFCIGDVRINCCGKRERVVIYF